MKETQEILIPEATFHVYNRANGSEKLFLNDENYRFFLAKYKTYIHPIAETFCYCLMPNHFHFLVRIRSEKELEGSTFPKFRTLEKFEQTTVLSKQFSNLFSSYTQAFNKVNHRKGSLFMKNFKRIKIEDETYLRKLVHYIHFNPITAGLCAEPLDWKYSSYRTLCSEAETMISRNEVISWFEDLQNFRFIHSQEPQLTGLQPF